jgi:hypothetical protein
MNVSTVRCRGVRECVLQFVTDLFERDATGNFLQLGAYFYTLRSGDYVSTKKSILLK